MRKRASCRAYLNRRSGELENPVCASGANFVSRLMGDLLDPAVGSHEEFDDVAGLVLYPSERELVNGASDARVREFATVRHCARTALAALGYDAAVPLTHGSSRQPLWPDGIVGSMTHCRGYRAAAVAAATHFASIGIDVERHAPLPDGILEAVTRPEERDQIHFLSSIKANVSWPRVLFSAKEATYKTWYPLTGRWLGFHDVSISLDANGGFVAKLLVLGPVVSDSRVSAFNGRWSVNRGLVLTAIGQRCESSI